MPGRRNLFNTPGALSPYEHPGGNHGQRPVRAHQRACGRPEDPAQHGLCAGAAPADGRIPELRHLLFHHLHSCRRHHRLPAVAQRGRRGVGRLRLAACFVVRSDRRRRDGTDRLRLPDSRRHIPLGFAAGWTRLRLGGGLVQPARPDVRGVVGELRRVPAVPRPVPGQRPGHGCVDLDQQGSLRSRVVDPDRLHHHHHGQPSHSESRRHPRHHHPDRLQRLPDLRVRHAADAGAPVLRTQHRPLAPVHLQQLLRRRRRGRLARGSAVHRVRVPARIAAGGVYDHRLRRLGTHRRRDAQRIARGPARHDPLGVLVVRSSAT